MQSETHQTVQTNEPIIAVPTHVEPHLLPHYYANDVTQILLALAVLTRSIALLIKVIRQQKGRK